MNDQQPTLNCLIRWVGTEACERLLCWHVPGESYYAIATEGPRAWPFVRTKVELDEALASGKAVVQTQDHLMEALRRDEVLTDKQKECQQKAWAVIKDLVEDAQHLIMDRRFSGRLIRESAEKHQVDLTSVYKYLRRYWQRGQSVAALQPNYHRCGSPGTTRVGGELKLGTVNADGEHVGINATDTVKINFEAAIKKYYLTEQRLPFRKVYLKMLADYYTVDYEVKNGAPSPVIAPAEQLPTFAQFRYYYDQNYRKSESLRRRIGKRRFEQNFREVTRDQTKSALGIGDIYQIDATTADVYLVLSSNPNIVVGRPVVYLVVDAFSKLVTGIHVTFFNMNYNAAAMAVWNAYSNKVEFCASAGVIGITPAHWPACGLPHTLLADRGELLGAKSDQIVKNLNVKVANAPAYSPTTKAIVERHFGLCNSEVIKWLPGAVPESNDDKAGKENYRKKASLTLEEFTEMLVRSVLAYNVSSLSDYQPTAAMIRDEVEPRPYKLWEWGLKHANYLRNMDARQVRLGLLPSDEGTVTKSGISFRGLFYTCAQAKVEEWFSSVRAGTNRWKVTCSYDPHQAGRIFLLGNGAGEFEECSLTENCQLFASWSWAEFEAYQSARNKSVLAGKKDDLALQAAAQSQMDSIASRAIKRRKEAGPANVKLLQAAKLEQQHAEEQQKTADLDRLLGSKPKPPEAVIPTVPSRVTSEWVSLCEEQLKEVV